MKLKFLLQKNAWFVEHERSWYCVSDEAQTRLAASALPLVVVDQNTLVSQPHLAGVAKLVGEAPLGERRLFGRTRNAEPAAVRVTLTEPDGTPVVERRVRLDRSALASIEWLTRPFDDGWLESSASLSLDNVKRLELRAYLPDSPHSKGKTLMVHDQTEGTTTKVWLERDKDNVVPLVSDGNGASRVLRLECKAEPNVAQNDRRQLGFLLLGESIEAA